MPAVQRSVEEAGAPGHRPNLDVGDSGPGVSLLQWFVGAATTGTFDQQTRRAVDRFQRQHGWDPSGVGPATWDRLDHHAGSPGNRPNLVQGDRGPGVRLLQRLLGVPETAVLDAATRKAADVFQRSQGWEPSGVGPATWAALDARPTGSPPPAPPVDALEVVVEGTWVDDFEECVYDPSYRISEGGSPSNWVKVSYRDGTTIDLNWYDFEDVHLDASQMMAALSARRLGPGNRVVPGRTSGGRLGLTRQLCPRLWAVHEDIEEIGAQSTLQLMAVAVQVVVFVLSVPAMPAGPPPPGAAPVRLRAARRSVPGGRPPSGGAPPPTPLSKVQAAREFYPGHGGEVGTLEAAGRDPMRVKSGVDGGPWGGSQRGGIPRGRGEAFTGGGPSQGNIATHVEGHTAAIMHQQGISEATLTMGRDQCLVCARNLPTALPPGSQLTVVHVDEAGRIWSTVYRSAQIPRTR